MCPPRALQNTFYEKTSTYQKTCLTWTLIHDVPEITQAQAYSSIECFSQGKTRSKTFLPMALGSSTKLRRFTNIKQYKKTSLT
jgi:hypothetical protein